jgi:sarcosine oxidase, subunit gamma
MCQVNVRAHGEALARVGEALGATLPTAPNTVTTSDTLSSLWLGPDEWLVVTDDVRRAAEIEAIVRKELAPDWGSVVDVSANRLALDLSGPTVRDMLATACPLDLHPRSFQAGQCAQTLFASTPVIIWQINDLPTFRLLVRTSYARHVAQWLADAAASLAPLP